MSFTTQPKPVDNFDIETPVITSAIDTSADTLSDLGTIADGLGGAYLLSRVIVGSDMLEVLYTSSYISRLVLEDGSIQAIDISDILGYAGFQDINQVVRDGTDFIYYFRAGGIRHFARYNSAYVYQSEVTLVDGDFAGVVDARCILIMPDNVVNVYADNTVRYYNLDGTKTGTPDLVLTVGWKLMGVYQFKTGFVGTLHEGTSASAVLFDVNYGIIDRSSTAIITAGSIWGGTLLGTTYMILDTSAINSFNRRFGVPLNERDEITGDNLGVIFETGDTYTIGNVTNTVYGIIDDNTISVNRDVSFPATIESIQKQDKDGCYIRGFFSNGKIVYVTRSS